MIVKLLARIRSLQIKKQNLEIKQYTDNQEKNTDISNMNNQFKNKLLEAEN